MSLNLKQSLNTRKTLKEHNCFHHKTQSSILIALILFVSLISVQCAKRDRHFKISKFVLIWKQITCKKKAIFCMFSYIYMQNFTIHILNRRVLWWHIWISWRFLHILSWRDKSNSQVKFFSIWLHNKKGRQIQWIQAY